MKYEPLYIPPRRRRPLFSRTDWLCILLGCSTVLAYFIGFAWLGGAFYSLLN